MIKKTKKTPPTEGNKPAVEKEVKKPTPKKKLSQPSKPKSTKPHPKSMHHQRSKKYQEVQKLVKRDKKYNLEEAIKLVKKISYAHFDASVDLHINVTRTGKLGEVDLPHSSGKTKRVVVVDDKVLKQIEDGQLDFDVLITHPQYMPKLAKFARILGPKGLMPNPKNGTITTEPEKVKAKLEKGNHLILKTEAKAPLIHLSIGRASFPEKQLKENIAAVLNAFKPSEVKAVFLAPTMGPSIRLQFPLQNKS